MQHELKEITGHSEFNILKVEKNCDLQTFLKEQKKIFYRGCAFFEFRNKAEDIAAGKRVILVNKVMIYEVHSNDMKNYTLARLLEQWSPAKQHA